MGLQVRPLRRDFVRPLVRAMKQSPAVTASYTQNRVDNAVTGYINRTTELTGMVDSATWTVSGWIRFDGATTTTGRIFNCFEAGGVGGFTVRRITASNNVVFAFTDSTGGVSTGSRTLAAGVADGSWHHFLIAVNSTGAGSIYSWWDGTAVDSNVAFVSAGFNFDWHTVPMVNHGICGTAAGANVIDGAVADIWLGNAFINDITKFYSAGAISLGADGSTPGVAPLIYMGGSMLAAQWNAAPVVNLGTGGNFTKAGAASFTDTT